MTSSTYVIHSSTHYIFDDDDDGDVLDTLAAVADQPSFAAADEDDDLARIFALSISAYNSYMNAA
eukprot:scaffold656882_cov76-Prasinocladus_malaysianus.AAC.1